MLMVARGGLVVGLDKWKGLVVGGEPLGSERDTCLSLSFADMACV